MKTLTDAMAALQSYERSYNILVNQFRKFQNAIVMMSITGLNVVGSTSTGGVTKNENSVIFLDRKYVVAFEMLVLSSEHKGKISMCRLLDDGTMGPANSKRVTFNRHGVLDVETPPTDDKLTLDEENTSMKLLLNWLVTDLGA